MTAPSPGHGLTDAERIAPCVCGDWHDLNFWLSEERRKMAASPPPAAAPHGHATGIYDPDNCIACDRAAPSLREALDLDTFIAGLDSPNHSEQSRRDWCDLFFRDMQRAFSASPAAAPTFSATFRDSMDAMPASNTTHSPPPRRYERRHGPSSTRMKRLDADDTTVSTRKIVELTEALSASPAERLDVERLARAIPVDLDYWTDRMRHANPDTVRAALASVIAAEYAPARLSPSATISEEEPST